MAAEIISRDDARAQGLKRFFTGTPCRNGHVAERLVSNGFCRDCRDATWKRFRERHPERVAANSDKQNSRLVDEGYFRSYYQKNDEKRKAEARGWYDANKERAQETISAWRERNPGKSRAIQLACVHRRRARLASADGSHTSADLVRIYARQRGKCALCKCSFADVDSELDHIISLAKGGSNYPANLQYLCRPCNRAKHAKDPIKFAQERGLLL